MYSSHTSMWIGFWDMWLKFDHSNLISSLFVCFLLNVWRFLMLAIDCRTNNTGNLELWGNNSSFSITRPLEWCDQIRLQFQTIQISFTGSARSTVTQHGLVIGKHKNRCQSKLQVFTSPVKVIQTTYVLALWFVGGKKQQQQQQICLTQSGQARSALRSYLSSVTHTTLHVYFIIYISPKSSLENAQPNLLQRKYEKVWICSIVVGLFKRNKWFNSYM